VYRVSETGTLRHYPTTAIAESWDSAYETNTIDIVDCEGLTLGVAMQIK